MGWAGSEAVAAAGYNSSRNGCIGNDGILACLRKDTIWYTGNLKGGAGYSVPKVSSLSRHRPLHSVMRCRGVSSILLLEGSSFGHIEHEGSAGGMIASPFLSVFPMCLVISAVLATLACTRF